MSTIEPIEYDVTEGGIIVRVTDEQGLDLTTPSDKYLRVRGNLTKITAQLEALHTAIPAMLADLAAALAELGEPCGLCDGEQGHTYEGPDGAEWVECWACDGSGMKQPVAA